MWILVYFRGLGYSGDQLGVYPHTHLRLEGSWPTESRNAVWKGSSPGSEGPVRSAGNSVKPDSFLLHRFPREAGNHFVKGLLRIGDEEWGEGSTANITNHENRDLEAQGGSSLHSRLSLRGWVGKQKRPGSSSGGCG